MLTGISGKDVWMGFIHVQGLEESLVMMLLDERTRGGNFLHLQDFIERTRPGIEQLNILIRIGAFRFTGKNKKELLWEANFLQKKSVNHEVNAVLFKEAPMKFELPALVQLPLDDAIDEIELLGFPVCNVFELVDDDPGRYLPAVAIEKQLGKEVMVMGYLVTSKPVHTIRKETMYFHTFIDANGDWLDTVFFPQTASRYPVTGKGFYSMKGKVVEEFGVFSVEVTWCKKIGIRDRAQKANELMKKDKSFEQILVMRPGTEAGIR
jgi:DNA polymerase-3 subunit alpha